MVIFWWINFHNIACPEKWIVKWCLPHYNLQKHFAKNAIYDICDWIIENYSKSHAH